MCELLEQHLRCIKEVDEEEISSSRHQSPTRSNDSQASKQQNSRSKSASKSTLLATPATVMILLGLILLLSHSVEICDSDDAADVPADAARWAILDCNESIEEDEEESNSESEEVDSERDFSATKDAMEAQVPGLTPKTPSYDVSSLDVFLELPAAPSSPSPLSSTVEDEEKSDSDIEGKHTTTKDTIEYYLGYGDCGAGSNNNNRPDSSSLAADEMSITTAASDDLGCYRRSMKRTRSFQRRIGVTKSLSSCSDVVKQSNQMEWVLEGLDMTVKNKNSLPHFSLQGEL